MMKNWSNHLAVENDTCHYMYLVIDVLSGDFIAS